VGGVVGGIPSAGAGGAAGNVPGFGGNIPGFDGGAVPRDAPGEGVGPRLQKSGCGCALGSSGLADSRYGLPLLLAGLVWSLRRRYRRHS
jgi:MYXO-CTERM domain-containing protein